MTNDGARSQTLLTVEKVLALKGVELFSALAEQDLVEIAYIAEEVDAAPGERVITRGEIGTSLYVIVSGGVRVHLGDRDVARLGQRDVFGELATLDPEPRSADVTALEDSVFLRIEGASLYDLMAEHPAVTRGVIAVLCERLRKATDRSGFSRGIPAAAGPAGSEAYKRIVVDGVRHYGKHLILGAAGCSEALLDIATMRRFIAELVERIDMRAYGECIVERFGSGIETGLSGVQLIETSAITLHTNDASRDLYLDVFSCKTFDEQAALRVVTEYFRPAATDMQVLLRR